MVKKVVHKKRRTAAQKAATLKMIKARWHGHKAKGKKAKKTAKRTVRKAKKVVKKTRRAKKSSCGCSVVRFK